MRFSPSTFTPLAFVYFALAVGCYGVAAWQGWIWRDIPPQIPTQPFVVASVALGGFTLFLTPPLLISTANHVVRRIKFVTGPRFATVGIFLAASVLCVACAGRRCTLAALAAVIFSLMSFAVTETKGLDEKMAADLEAAAVEEGRAAAASGVELQRPTKAVVAPA
ncbi:hypothetical protein RQP46_000059 [Phenoliferia psychrophenolica]